MAELLFEIFCEEIPARMQQRAGQDLSKALVDGLKKAGLTVEGEHCYTAVSYTHLTLPTIYSV